MTTGTVTFYANGSPIGTANLDSTGSATFPTSSLPPGTSSITAVYSGPAAYHTSTSTVLTQTVAAHPTINGYQAVFTQKKNKRGKAVGRPVFSGFRFTFSDAMSASVGSKANYTMGTYVTKRVGRKNTTVLQTVQFTANRTPREPW